MSRSADSLTESVLRAEIHGKREIRWRQSFSVHGHEPPLLRGPFGAVPCGAVALDYHSGRACHGVHVPMEAASVEIIHPVASGRICNRIAGKRAKMRPVAPIRHHFLLAVVPAKHRPLYRRVCERVSDCRIGRINRVFGIDVLDEGGVNLVHVAELREHLRKSVLELVGDGYFGARYRANLIARKRTGASYIVETHPFGKTCCRNGVVPFEIVAFLVDNHSRNCPRALRKPLPIASPSTAHI